jgi:hypothetical protein
MFKRIKVTITATIIGCLAISGFLLATPDYKASGAGEVTTHQKVKCIKIYKNQRARDAMKFPPHPTLTDLKKRVPDWYNFVKLGRCEQPSASEIHGVAWSHQGPTWGGGLGIYKSTWYMAKSPYRLWSGSYIETILVADAIRDQVGITAWGAHRCFYS